MTELRSTFCPVDMPNAVKFDGILFEFVNVCNCVGVEPNI